MLGSMIQEARTAVGITFVWTPHPGVEVDGDTLRFGVTPRVPGIYRIDLADWHTYIGEAADLERRFRNFRSPGGSPDTKAPRTNRRVQRAIIAALEAGRTVTIRTCSSAWLEMEGTEAPLGFDVKSNRLLIESAAIVLATDQGWTLENLTRS
jgi:hypothetical protein